MSDILEQEYLRVCENLKNRDENDFTFLFITDMHVDFPNVEETITPQCKIASRLAEKINADCIILGGDIIHGTSQKKDSLNYLKKYVELLSGSVPVFAARGNHDDNGYHSDKIPWSFDPKQVPFEQVIGAKEWTKNIIKPLAKNMTVHDLDNENSSYYYVDFENKKTRLIFLDAYNYPLIQNGKYALNTSKSWNKIDDKQIEWFVKNALDINKKDWTFYLVSHCVFDKKIPHLTVPNSSEILNVIKAFNKKGVYKNERLNLTKDFSTNTSRMPASFFGHTHIDSITFETDIPLTFFCTGNAKATSYEINGYTCDYLSSPKREKDTPSEYLFDIYTINQEKLSSIRFGAGKSHKVDLLNQKFE